MRRRRAEQRSISPDLIYKSVLVAKIINNIMWDGKKTVAERAFYKAMDIVKDKTGQDPMEVLKKVMSNIMPRLEVRPRRVGGATYQVPIEIAENRRLALALRWIIKNSRAKEQRVH